jgi:hypothetical protein
MLAGRPAAAPVSGVWGPGASFGRTAGPRPGNRLATVESPTRAAASPRSATERLRVSGVSAKWGQKWAPYLLSRDVIEGIGDRGRPQAVPWAPSRGGGLASPGHEWRLRAPRLGRGVEPGTAPTRTGSAAGGPGVGSSGRARPGTNGGLSRASSAPRQAVTERPRDGPTPGAVARPGP